MKKRMMFFLVLTLLLGMAQPALAAETAATMQLSVTEGTVKVSNASGRSLTLRDNMRLYSGYQVETSAKSYAWINLDDTKLVKLDASTKVEIRKSGKKLEVLLKSGSMYGDVSKPLESDETLNIRTSTAIVGIRGTKFSVAQVKLEEPAPGETAVAQWTTQVQVYEGAVDVTARRETPETATVAAGRQLQVNPDSGQTETFTHSELSSGHIAGYAAVELVKTPETLNDLNMDITQEAAQRLLEQNQRDAERRQAETVKTGLETTADPNVVWSGGSTSAPSGGGGSTSNPDPIPTPDPVCAVIFNPNGGTGGGTVLTNTAGKLAGIVPTVERSGYAFVGWNTVADGSGDAIDPASHIFMADAALYAQWTAIPACTVTFDPNGGSWGGDTASKTVAANADGLLASSVSDPARGGYAFDGWYTAPSGGTKADLTAAFTADTVFYAQWTPVYTITFDPNGGSWGGDTASKAVAANTDGLLASSVSDPARGGYVFDGWYTAPSGGTKADLTAAFTADTILYAQWLSATVQVDRELSADGSQEAAQQKIQDMLNNPAYTKVTVELTPYGEDAGQVSYLYLKGGFTVPEGKELEMNCYFQVGSNDSFSGSSQEPDGRPLAAGELTVNGTLTVNNGMSLCTSTDKGVSTITIGSTGTLADHSSWTNEINGNVDNSGTLRIAAGGWQLSGHTTFTNSGTVENQGTVSNLDCAFTNRGTFHSNGAFTNGSTFTNEAGGTFSLNGTLTNNNAGTFTNGGTFTALTGAVIINEGTISNEGILVIGCAAANFTNSGAITNNGTYYGPALTGGTIGGANAGQVTDGNSEQGETIP